MRFCQPGDGYRVAVDPILLASAVRIPAGSRVLDAGCGTGAALLCLLTRETKCTGLGLDQQSDLVALAKRNIEANELQDRAQVFQGKLATPPDALVPPVDVVITNPPYFEAGTVKHTPKDVQSHSESDLTLPQWIRACLKLLRPEGLFAIIHRAERLSDIVSEFHGKAGAITIIPIWSKAGVPAKRVIVTALKGRRSPTSLQPGLVLHTADGAYTPAAQAILRDGAALQTMA